MRRVGRRGIAITALVFLAMVGPAVAQPPAADELSQRLADAARGRFDIKQVAQLETETGWATVFTIAFGFTDPQGERQRAGAKIFLPPEALAAPATRVGLLYAAGYEFPEKWARPWLREAWLWPRP